VNEYSSKFRALLRDVYSCNICPSSYGFKYSPNGSYFKFPPLIGRTSSVDLLFVGINPRRTYSNSDLHTTLMSSKVAFANLASNKSEGHSYVSRGSAELHYRFHVGLVERIYGKSKPFESVAAVTELFLCASARANTLPNSGSPCADRFFSRTLEIAQPKVIIALGRKVLGYFKTKPHKPVEPDEILIQTRGSEFPVISICHPANPAISEIEKEALITDIARRIRRWINV
jgi:hypothetical protein